MILGRLAVVSVAIALAGAAWSYASGPAPSAPVQLPPATPVDPILEPIHGLKPLPEIVELWRTRATAAPSDYFSRTELGLALAALARETADLDGFDDSEIALRSALEVNPTFASAQLALASTLIAQHEFGEALELASAVGSEDPTNLAALALIGDAELELGNYQEASAAYERLAATERSAPTVSRLARVAWLRGDPVSAVALADEALELSSDLALRPHSEAFYWYQSGHFRFVAGDTVSAIEALEQALAIAPEHPAASEELAFVYASTERRDDAAELYQQILERSPAADLHGLYADLLEDAGAGDAAEIQEDAGLRLADDTIDRYPAERRHLVSFYTTRDPELAVELAELDLATRQDVGAYDVYAWALFHAGRVNDAADAIDAALSEGTQDASLWYHAGAIAAALGDDESAGGYLEAALELNPAFHPTEGAAALHLLSTLGGQ